MPRARNKQELLDYGEKQYNLLIDLVKKYKDMELLDVEVLENRTVKDIIAHLYDWHQLLFTWYFEGEADRSPEIPAPGYTWKTTPELNEKLYQLSKDKKFDDVMTAFKNSHVKMMKLIQEKTDTSLEEKKYYSWTGTANLCSYFASATSSHYTWAIDLLKKKLR